MAVGNAGNSTSGQGSSLDDYLVYTTAPGSPTTSQHSSKGDNSAAIENEESLPATPPQAPQVQQCFLTPLPGFRRVPATAGSLLQIAPTESGQLGTPTGFYFQQNFAPLLQSGMRFVVGNSPATTVSSTAASTNENTPDPDHPAI